MELPASRTGTVWCSFPRGIGKRVFYALFGQTWTLNSLAETSPRYESYCCLNDRHAAPLMISATLLDMNEEPRLEMRLELLRKGEL